METLEQVEQVEKAIDLRLLSAFEEVLPNVMWLWDAQAWRIKNVKTWDIYFKARFPNFVHLNQTDRRKAVKIMNKKGMTNRAIAVVLGVNRKTIDNDVLFMAQNGPPNKPEQPEHQDQKPNDHKKPEPKMRKPTKLRPRTTPVKPDPVIINDDHQYAIVRANLTGARNRFVSTIEAWSKIANPTNEMTSWANARVEEVIESIAMLKTAINTNSDTISDELSKFFKGEGT